MITKPNIIFILIDDMGWRDLSCFGSSFYETPNIDRLAAEGMSFTNAYAACPVCSPTRASLISGQYPARIGLTNYIGGDEHPSKGKLIDAPYVDHLPKSIQTLADTMKQADYQTWHIGKWHLGDESYYPDKRGFDVNIGGCHYGSPWQGYFSPYHIPTLPEGPEGEYLTDRLTTEAIHLLETRDTDKPFFMNLWYYTVHNPIQAPQEYIDKFIEKAHSLGLDDKNPFEVGEIFPTQEKVGKRIMRRLFQSNPYYAAMIYSLDQNVGRLMEALQNSSAADNTLVIFTSDNGGLATSEGSPTSNKPLSEGKGWMYEGGTREPMIAWWPNEISSSSICNHPITSPDFYPTFAELAGTTCPKTQICDGQSFLPLLKHGKVDQERAIFWHYPHYGNQGGTPGSSILKGDYKLIHFFEDNHVELYNLCDDIGEIIDVSKQQPEIAAELKKDLDQWVDSIEAAIPQNNPEYDGFSDTRKHHEIYPITRFDLDTPLGVLLYNLEAKGILKKYIDIDNIEDINFIGSFNDRSLQQLANDFEIPLDDLLKELGKIVLK